MVDDVPARTGNYGPEVPPPPPAPILGLSGDVSGAEDVVAPGATVVFLTNVLDTTGTGIQAATLEFLGSVELVPVAPGAVFATFDVLLDGAPLAPPLGEFIRADATNVHPIVTVAFGSTFLLPEGPHTIQVRCTTDANTTANINPVVAGNLFSRFELLIFR